MTFFANVYSKFPKIVFDQPKFVHIKVIFGGKFFQRRKLRPMIEEKNDLRGLKDKCPRLPFTFRVRARKSQPRSLIGFFNRVKFRRENPRQDERAASSEPIQ